MDSGAKKEPGWHTIAFKVPDLASFDDAALERHFFERDGAWHSQSRRALARFGTDKLDLDENWASVHSEWDCPGCGRPKRELFRPSANGVLLARLDIHHDHLVDRLKARLRLEIGKDWNQRIARDTFHFEELAPRLVARFEPTLVCLDCNKADGDVKRRCKQIPRDFSFRPSEIRQFITPRPNAEHEIDAAAALRIFEAARPDFDQRCALLDAMFEMMAKGELLQEKGNLPPSSAPRWLALPEYLHRSFLRSDWPGYQTVSRDLDAFLMRSVSRAGVASSSKASSRPIRTPSAQDIASHDGAGAPDLWNAVSSEWRCPGCGRAKAEIVRASNNAKRKWSGKLMRHQEFFLTDACDDGDDYREWVDRHEVLLVCMDCANILPAAKQREPSISRHDVLFQLRDMRMVAKAAPHRPHDIDWNLAIELARKSEELHTLTIAYWDHYHAALGCRARYQEYLAYFLGDEARAWRHLRRYYADCLGETPDDLDEQLSFLLSEADRIGLDDPYRREEDDADSAFG